MMNKIIENAWVELLTRATKNQGTSHVTVEDDIDLYVPQSRLLSLLEFNRTVPRLMYLSAQESAHRNTYLIVRKLGMPSDYFWKFEYWPVGRAYTTLSKIVHRIFSTIMTEAGEGELVVKELSIDPLEVHIDFNSCAECAGIHGIDHGICYYHAGTFAGMVGALLNMEDLDCYETTCHAAGNDSCSFVLGGSSNKQFAREFESFITPSDTRIDLGDRLTTSLRKNSVRSMGNTVDINYLRLITANLLLDNPRLFTSMNLEAGQRFGRTMADVIRKFYNDDPREAVKRYYRDTSHLSVEIAEDTAGLRVTVKELLSTDYNTPEMMSFLTGELQGFASAITGSDMNVKESRFTAGGLELLLVP